MAGNLHKNTEIEVRFLNIDKGVLAGKLRTLGAEEIPEHMTEEVIFYDPDLKWRDVEKRFVRLRKKGESIVLTYKHNMQGTTLSGVEEIEFPVPEMEKVSLLLQRLNLMPYRRQQKLRHSFRFQGASIDIDTWPTVPPYAEIEGESEAHVRGIALALGLDWSQKVTDDALVVLEKHYNIPFGSLRVFTFDHIA